MHLMLTILAVRDLTQAIKFYGDAFGWPQMVDTPAYAEFDMGDGRHLGLYDRRSFGVNTGQVPVDTPGGALTGTELYFYADDRHDLEQAIARLEGAGARKLSALATRDWGDEAAYFADPDGNVLVMARHLEG